MVLCLALFSCQEQQKPIEQIFTITAGKEFIVEKIVNDISLNDSLSFIGTEALYRIIGQDSGIVKDASLKLSLYINHRFVHVIGKTGKGTKEYASVDDIDFYKDTLFVLDNSNGKIIGYSITTGDCVYELLSKDITNYGITSLTRFDGRFLLGNCRYIPPEFKNAKNISKALKGEDLFLIMDDKGTSKVIGPKRSELEFFDIFPVSCATWGKALKIQNNYLFACLPLAKSAIQIDLKNYTYKKLPIYLDIADLKTKITYAKITLNGLEIAEEIFPFKDSTGFAISSKVIANNKAKRIVRVYDSKNDTKGYILDKKSEAFGGSISSISDVTPQTFTTFYAHRPEDKTVFPYALIMQKYR